MDLAQRLERIASLLIDQQRAKVIIAPMRPGTGHWFGGGNLIEDRQGTLWLVGRYRNQGDSRTGVGAGERGLELAVFRSDDQGQSFSKAFHWSKSDLKVGDHDVLSIEGSAIRETDQGVELFVSTEKSGIGYPDGLESFLKPGTGVWTIDRIAADSFEGLADAEPSPMIASCDPSTVHIKDPFLGRVGNEDCLWFCSHPFCWTSSNTGFAPIDPSGNVTGSAVHDAFPRGYTWDVAITRGTAVVPIEVGGESLDLLFYDGGECVRNLDEHAEAVKRPRGYSCEELGGLAYFTHGDPKTLSRVSINRPLFVSPFGTGCSRYVDVLVTSRGFYATWQQGQPDGSQPLVMNFVSNDEMSELTR